MKLNTRDPDVNRKHKLTSYLSSTGLVGSVVQLQILNIEGVLNATRFIASSTCSRQKQQMRDVELGFNFQRIKVVIGCL